MQVRLVLCGGILHFGKSTTSGHYTAFSLCDALGGSPAFFTLDDTVTPSMVLLERLTDTQRYFNQRINDHAYVLFYQVVIGTGTEQTRVEFEDMRYAARLQAKE
jgi:hypothetical protein